MALGCSTCATQTQKVSWYAHELTRRRLASALAFALAGSLKLSLVMKGFVYLWSLGRRLFVGSDCNWLRLQQGHHLCTVHACIKMNVTRSPRSIGFDASSGLLRKEDEQALVSSLNLLECGPCKTVWNSLKSACHDLLKPFVMIPCMQGCWPVP